MPFVNNGYSCSLPSCVRCFDALMVHAAALRTWVLLDHLELMLMVGIGCAPPFVQPLMNFMVQFAITLFARRLCTTFLSPDILSPFLAYRLIALIRFLGVMPIGVCEGGMIYCGKGNSL